MVFKTRKKVQNPIFILGFTPFLALQRLTTHKLWQFRVCTLNPTNYPQILPKNSLDSAVFVAFVFLCAAADGLGFAVALQGDFACDSQKLASHCCGAF